MMTMQQRGRSRPIRPGARTEPNLSIVGRTTFLACQIGQSPMSTTDHGSSSFRTLRELWRSHKVAFVVTLCITMLAGLYMTLNMLPDVYEAKAVLVRRPSTRAAATRSLGTTVLSRDVLAAAAREMRLLAADALPSDRERVVDRLEGMLKVATPTPTEIAILGRGHDKTELVLLVNTVARTYVTRLATANDAATSQATSLREARARELEALAAEEKRHARELAAATAALDRFEAEHADVLGRTGSDPLKTLEELTAEHKEKSKALAALRTKVKALEAGAGILRDKLKTVPEFIETRETTTERDPERTMLEREIRLMERQLDQMLKTYTYKHPEVLKHQMNLLVKKRQLRQLKTRVETRVRSTREPNLEYAALKGKLDDKMVQLQEVRSALAELNGKPEALAKRTDALRELVGSHRMLTDKVATSTKRHQKAKTDLAAKTATPEAPVVTLEPAPEISRKADIGSVRLVGPRRSLWVTGAAVLSVVLGLAAMSVTFHLSPGFSSAYEVSRITGTGVYGTISAVAGTDAARRRRLRKLAKLGILLVLTAVAALAAGVMLSGTT